MSDTTTDYVAAVVPPGKYLVDPYQDWAMAEGVPIVTGRAVDLMTIETWPWARFDCRGAIANVDGRCDFLSVFLLEVAAGQTTAPQRHVYDELSCVLAGSGETEVSQTDGSVSKVEWRPGTLLGMPGNAQYRHRNLGDTPARIAAFNDLRYLISLYRNQQFIFDNPSPPSPAAGDIACWPGAAGTAAPEALGSARPIVLGSGTIGADLIELGEGGRGMARRQMQGGHLLGLGGDGMTRSWRDGSSAVSEARWRHGVLVGLPSMHFHRHVNIGRGKACALEIALGSARFPMLRSRRNHYGDKSVYASGAAEIE